MLWLVRRLAAWSPLATGSACLYAAEFRGGRSIGSQGTLPRAVVNAFEDVAFLSGVDGHVRVFDGNQIEFSASIPEPVRQQFRNVLLAAPR